MNALRWAFWLRGLACVLPAVLVWHAAPPPDALRHGLALFVLIGGLWLTQALHLSLTALLVPLLAVLTGLLDMRAALAPFAHPIIFLFLGGFALAAALQQQGLDQQLAHAVLRLAGGHRQRAALLLFALSALLSMWISNSATAAMMLPLALGLLHAGDGPRERAYVLLGVAYSASIGGMGTLVGSPPNAIAAAQAGIGFAEWLRFGLPLVLLTWPLMAAVLQLLLRPVFRPAPGPALPAAGPAADDAGRQLRRWTGPQRRTLCIFMLAGAGWVGAAPLGRLLGLAADVDSLVALAAVLALLASGALSWPQFERRTQWGVLLLFGGGLALSEVMAASGASAHLAGLLTGALHGAAPWLLVLGVVAFVVFLSELVSNTAAAALLVPVFIGVAVQLGLPPPLLAGAIAAAASCAFMLPVGTPPNAMVYATGDVPQATMVRCGLVLNLACIALITALALALLS